MLGRSVYDIKKAIYAFENQMGESFTDYFLDNYPFGSWAYWLLGRGHHIVANNLIDRNEKGECLDQQEKFEFLMPEDGPFCDVAYDDCVTLWAAYIFESNQYFRRFTEFLKEQSIDI